MEQERSAILKFRDDDIDYEISVDLLENSIKFRLKCLDDFTRYEKEFKIKDLLGSRPFIIIEDKYEIYQVIVQGITIENSIKIKRNDSFNIMLSFNTFFAKKYTNSFELDLVLDESINSDFLLLEILKQVKKLKVENEQLFKDNQMLKTEQKNFNKILENYRDEVFDLKERLNNLSVSDICYDEYLNFENYNFLCDSHFKKRFKYELIYSQEGINLNKNDLTAFKNKIRAKENLIYVVSLKLKQEKLLFGFFQSIALQKDLNNENYYDDAKSFVVEFDSKTIFKACVDKAKQIRTCSGYYFLFGNDGNFNGFYIRDDTSSLPNIYKRSEFFNMKGNSKAGFEFDNSNVERLNVYSIDFIVNLNDFNKK